jgi:hypothetical protein
LHAPGIGKAGPAADFGQFVFKENGDQGSWSPFLF